MADKSKSKNPVVSLIGGIVMTVLLVVVVPVIVSYFIEPIVTDAIGDTTIAGLAPGAIGAIVMFVVLILFMLLLGGGAILRKFGVIGIVGLILAYVFLLDQMWGWVVPVAIVVLLGVVSYLREKKKESK